MNENLAHEIQDPGHGMGNFTSVEFSSTDHLGSSFSLRMKTAIPNSTSIS